jgi:hypothetical protein
MEQEIYRVKDFCQRYAISRTSFYRELNAKRLSAIKRGRCTFITRDEAERWFRSLGYFKTPEFIERHSADAPVK